MSIPKRHHYVPRCYLNEFRKEKKLICLNLIHTLKGVDVKLSIKEPNQICYIEDYYKISKEYYFDLKSYNEYHIELKSFSKLENEYRDVVQILINEFKLESHNATILCDFILNLKIRNPSFNKFIEHHKEKNVQIAKENLINKMMKDYRFNGLPYSFLKMQVDSFGEKILKSSNFNKSLQLQQIIDKTDEKSLNILKFRKEILDCKWYLLDSQDSEYSFITSDNPGISITNEGVLENIKFKNGFKFYFPINENYCLYFSDEEKDQFYTEDKKVKIIYSKNISTIEVKLVNIYQVCYHNKYAISTEEKNLIYLKNELLK